MFKATLKSLLSRKLRLVLSGLAVVLAVMFVTGAFVLSDTLGRSFDSLFTSAYDYTDIQVTAKAKIESTGQTGAVMDPVDAAAINQAKQVPGVKTARGIVIVDGARVIGKNGKVLPTTGSPRFGTAWDGDSQLVKLREGRGPRAPDEVAINGHVAELSGYKVGDSVDILTPEPPRRTFTVVGIFGYTGGRDSIGGEQTVAFTEPVAQQLMLRAAGRYSAINVTVVDKHDLTKVRDALRTAMGPGFDVQTGKDLAKQSADQIKKALSFVTYLLLGFAAVALLVGVFLILNTFSIIVAQRTRELALLRAMGASRRQMVGSVLLEATLIGLLSWLIGLALGIGIGALGGYALVTLASGLPAAGVGVPLSAILVSLIVGVGVTVVAALVPALHAAQVPPVAAMREAATSDRPLTKLTVSGGVLLVGGVALLSWGLSGKAHGSTLSVILIGVLATFIAVALLTPLLGRPIVSLLGRLFAWSVPGQLGRRNSARNPRRTAITAAAMMISIALVTGISTVFSSVSESIAKLVDEQLHADLVIAGQQTSEIPPSIQPEALTQIRGLSDVDSVVADSYDAAGVAGKPALIGAFDDMATAVRVLDFKRAQGRIDSLESGEFITSADTAKAQHWHVGDQVDVQLARGTPSKQRLVGIYATTQAVTGILMLISWSDAENGFRSPTAVQAFVKLRPGADVATAKQQVDQILRDSPEVNVVTRSEYVGQTTQFFDIVLVIVQVLLGVAMLIAVLGIVNTLALSVLERTRELGMLRAIGLRRLQTARMITVEAVVISLFGALLGLIVGAALGAAVVHALKSSGITVLAFPWTLMVTYLIAGGVVGVVASLIPAIRAARLDVLAAIAYE
jgi:putative ABC transport system permease protein